MVGNILLVDDEPVVTEMVKQLLELLGHTVSVATDFDTAWALWSERSGQFDLAIVDYTLGTQTGADLIRGFWSEKPNLRVILSTGSVPDQLPLDDEMRRRLAFLNKPFRVTCLRDVVTQVLAS